MARSSSPFRWSSLRGYSQRTAPQALPPDMGTVAQNVELILGTLGRRRPSTTNVSMTSGPSGEISYGAVYRPDNAAAQLWAFAGGTTMSAHSFTSSGGWTSRTLTDVSVGVTPFPIAVTFNNKLFVAFNNSASCRLHCWDGSAFRRVGLLKPSAAPTVADTGAGAYAATARRYRVSFRIISGSDVVCESELSAAVSFTPSGGGTAARVTKPTTVDSATHWVVWALIGTSGDTYDLYENISGNIAVGTTIYDDSVNPASYDGAFPSKLGLHIPPPAAQFLLTDGSRLLMAGAWKSSANTGETVPKRDRVWFTRVTGTTDNGDDETIPNTTEQQNWIDVGEKDGDPIVGLAGPVDGIVYVLKQRSFYRLIPTGNDLVPYRQERIAGVGANQSATIVNHRCAVLAENVYGQAEAYFVPMVGPYRNSPAGGIEYVGWDISNATTGLGPTLTSGIFVREKRQVWWLETGTDLIHVYTPSLARRTENAIEGGWAKYTVSDMDTPNALVMFEANGGAEYPVLVGAHAGAGKVIFFGSTDATDAGGTTYTATITSRPILFEGGTHRASLENPILEGAVQNGATPSVSYVVDYGRETRTATAPSLAAAGSETRKAVLVEGLEAADAQAVQLTVQWDSDQTHTIDALTVPYRVQEHL
jgi:hypothetical protein